MSSESPAPEDGGSLLDQARQAAAVFLGGGAASVVLFRAGTANRSFAVEDGDGAGYVLRRRSSRYAGEAFAAFEAEFLAHLAGAGLPVPRLLAAPGGPFLRLYGGLWQMSRRIGGAPYSGGPGQIRQAGRLLARLHNASAGFVPANPRPDVRYEHPRRLREQYRQFLTAHPRLRGAEDLRWVPRLLDRLDGELSDCRYDALPRLHIHGDYHSANLLFEGDAVTGLFDFDGVRLQARLRDVADGVIFFGSRRKSPIDDHDILSLTQGFEPRPALYSLFLEGYAETAGAALTAGETELLPVFIAARFLGMRLDALAKVPHDGQPALLTHDTGEPLRWLQSADGSNIHP